ncbi:MAG: hypothetical protein A2297_06445 [Elusimicrobia bacterium RIFOXYB2_FULL_48_7]|nr:MAG: hypothetical protein A2297_06445 [Elusimicrobia bacterium RIFOXYB2_FULL_48_7]
MNKRAHVIALAGYILITLFFLAPLLPHFNTHIPGLKSDSMVFLWNLWWVKKAFVSLHSNPFFCDYILYPFGVYLTTHPLSLLNGIISLPLQFVFSEAVTYNLLVVKSFVLPAFGMYFLVTYLVNNRKAAFISGIIFSFSPYKLIHLYAGQLNVISTEWIPFYVLFLIKTFKDDFKVHNALLAGLFLVFSAFTFEYYFVFLLIFTVIYACYMLFMHNKAFNKDLGKSFGIFALVLIIGLLPLYYNVLLQIINDRYILASQKRIAEVYSADLFSYLIPSTTHFLWGNIVVNYVKFPAGGEAMSFSGFLVLIVAVYAGIKYSDKYSDIRLWNITGIIFFVISLGPVLHVWGKEHIFGLPFRVFLPGVFFEYLPIIGNARVMGRYSIMALFVLSVLFAYYYKNLESRIHGRVKIFTVMGMMIFVILFEYYEKLQINNISVPSNYEKISRENGDFTVLELPLDWGIGYPNGYNTQIELQYYQTKHDKRVIGGVRARCPSNTIEKFLSVPLINKLFILGLKKEIPRVDLSDRVAAKGMINALDIGYIILHKEHFKGKVLEIRGYLEKLFPVSLVSEDPGMLLYKAEKSRVFNREQALKWINEYLPNPEIIYMRGWYDLEAGDGITFRWSDGKVGRVIAKIGDVGDYSLETRVMPFPYDSKKHKIEVTVNRHRLIVWELKPDWNNYSVIIPASFLVKGDNSIEFHSNCASIIKEVLPSCNDPRKISVGVGYIRMKSLK